MENLKVLAVDFGGSSGRVMEGMWNGETISLQEAHRFENAPVSLGDTLYWDFLQLFNQMKIGLAKANRQGAFHSLGIDTWGVDFGLLDTSGHLLETPVSYRDTRTSGLAEKQQFLSREELYSTTGNQVMDINTAFQLTALKNSRPHILENASQLLMMPDLFGYFLTGVRAAELSSASTTQLLDIHTGKWAKSVMDAFGIHSRIFPEISNPGSVLGSITPAIQTEMQLAGAKVISVCGHDTQSALVAVPAESDDFAFISSGTWSLFGTELDAPLVTPQSYQCNLTNELGFGKKTAYLKNIVGLWLVQESRRQWMREGQEYSFPELALQADSAPAFVSFINPDDSAFSPAGNVPKRIQEFCRQTSQPIPQTPGEIMRCIYQSLALTYKATLAQLRQTTGKKLPVIHMVGGGSKDSFLCQLTADACGCPVLAGPAEATALGNLLVQLIAAGEIKDLAQARKVALHSSQVKRYSPSNSNQWQQAESFFKTIADHQSNFG